jgi:hypothetical protein
MIAPAAQALLRAGRFAEAFGQLGDAVTMDETFAVHALQGVFGNNGQGAQGYLGDLIDCALYRPAVLTRDEAEEEAHD